MRAATIAGLLAMLVCAPKALEAESHGGGRLIPGVIPSADELANPHLYHDFDREYRPPPLLGPAPPAGIVKPGEFEPADATMISIVDWGSDDMLDMWAELVSVYAMAGHVWIITYQNWILDGFAESRLEPRDVPADRYSFLDYPLDHWWVRDYAPEFVYLESGERAVIDAYYPGRPADDQIPAFVAESDWIGSDGEPLALHAHEHHLAGGNIMTDGMGTCFFSDIIYGYEKPTGWTNEDVDDTMTEYYGCDEVIVLSPIPRDLTGHVDLYAKLVGPTAFLLGAFPADTRFEEDFDAMEDNLAIVAQAANGDGAPFVVTRVPMLEPYEGTQASWVYRSYLNSEIVNDYVVMPAYYEPRAAGEDEDYLLDMEAQAVDAYETANPASTGLVFPIDSDFVIEYAGAVHCISHEIVREAGGGWTAPDEYCGDGVVQAGEECERIDLSGQTCQTLGFLEGTLYCGPGCALDTSDCAGDAGTDQPVDGSPEVDAGPDAGATSKATGGSCECGVFSSGPRGSLLGLLLM